MKAQIEVPALDLQRMTLEIIGDTPLISHRFSDKAKNAILDKQQRKAKQGRVIRDPQAEFEASLYEIPGVDGAYGFPAMAFKSAAVRAAKSVPDMTMVDTRGYFHIVCDSHMLVPLRYEELKMVEDRVVIGRGVADLRYRGYFYGWSALIEVEYNASVISAEQIVLLFDIGGFSVGIGDWRPEKGGMYGRFHVKKEGEE